MRILSKLNAMSLGKKIYTAIWAVTGALLIALIAMFVSLNKSYTKTTAPKDGWSVTSTTGVVVDKSAQTVTLKTDAADDIVDSTGTVVVTKGTTAGTKLTFDQVKHVELFSKYFEIIKPTTTTSANQIYTLGEWKAELTADAKSAINSTATIASLFVAGLMGSIFTTVGVSIHDKRRGGSK